MDFSKCTQFSVIEALSTTACVDSSLSWGWCSWRVSYKKV